MASELIQHITTVTTVNFTVSWYIGKHISFRIEILFLYNKNSVIKCLGVIYSLKPLINQPWIRTWKHRTLWYNFNNVSTYALLFEFNALTLVREQRSKRTSSELANRTALLAQIWLPTDPLCNSSKTNMNTIESFLFIARCIHQRCHQDICFIVHA